MCGHLASHPFVPAGLSQGAPTDPRRPQSSVCLCKVKPDRCHPAQHSTANSNFSNMQLNSNQFNQTDKIHVFQRISEQHAQSARAIRESGIQQAERVGQHGTYWRRDMLLHTSVRCALHDASNSLKWGWEKSFPA
eukprot:453663-Amphidinium_carterae.1